MFKREPYAGKNTDTAYQGLIEIRCKRLVSERISYNPIAIEFKSKRPSLRSVVTILPSCCIAKIGQALVTYKPFESRKLSLSFSLGEFAQRELSLQLAQQIIIFKLKKAGTG